MRVEEINLYDGIFDVSIMAYLQEPLIVNNTLKARPAILICPGGAYISFTENEGEPVALRFLGEGYQAFVLKYSIGAGVANFPTPFYDAARAIALIRQNARQWHIDSNQITLCGFSTGGHIAAMLASSWQEDFFLEHLKVDKALIKPNTLILGYPILDLYRLVEKHRQDDEVKPTIEMMLAATLGTSMPTEDELGKWNAIDKVSEDMPPVFMWTTSEDRLVDVEDSLHLIKALARNNLPYEYHIFEKGAHGLSIADGRVGYEEKQMSQLINAPDWINYALKWLKSRR